MKELSYSKMEKHYTQVRAIMALEDMHPSPQDIAIGEAICAGRVTIAQHLSELTEYAKLHKTSDGYIESRKWFNP